MSSVEAVVSTASSLPIAAKDSGLYSGRLGAPTP
jgi:hypothetical protein